MESAYFFLLIISFLIVFIILISDFKIDWLKNDKRFITKKIVDIIFITNLYIFASSILYLYDPISQQNVIKKLILYLLCLIVPVNSIRLIYKGYYNYSKADNLSIKAFPYVITSAVIRMVVSFAQINLFLYYLDSAMFKMDYSLPHILGFDFIYYSFNITVAYSDGNIVAVGILPKVIQLIYISVVYFFIIHAITTLLKKANKAE